MHEVSPFWIQLFYAYLDYDTSLEGTGFLELRRMLNRRAWSNIQAGVLSPTGQFYGEETAVVSGDL
ncbi:MAG: hypothetical protein H5T72_05255 [Actinobacteria bacterium]|nr:hypothetical protein [Actinomycetota bacterium]